MSKTIFITSKYNIIMDTIIDITLDITNLHLTQRYPTIIKKYLPT